MHWFNILILSLVEGVTEFLPVSSTGHMIVVSKFLSLSQTKVLKAFEVIIQLAAILAIVLFYRHRLRWSQRQLWLKVFLAFLPVGIVGFLLADLVKSLFSVPIIALMFILGGLVFIFIEKRYSSFSHQTQSLDSITWQQAFKIGLWQVLALIPGTSRSGATIVGGLLSGLDRHTATKFSFLLALPVVLAASGFDLLKHYRLFTLQEWHLLLFASLVAFISAYLTVKFFLTYLKHHNFTFFGWYRLLFGLILLLFFL